MTISMSKGQKVSLAKRGGGSLTVVRMGLGWDADSKSVVVELLAVIEEEVDESVVLDDTDEGPDALRVF